jgi:hypothetical protein
MMFLYIGGSSCVLGCLFVVSFFSLFLVELVSWALPPGCVNWVCTFYKKQGHRAFPLKKYASSTSG